MTDPTTADSSAAAGTEGETPVGAVTPAPDDEPLEVTPSRPTVEPVERIPPDRTEKPLKDAMAICLSGGGARALLFHVGALWRLHELGLLTQVDRVSSVSGGSIVAGVVAMNWSALAADGDRRPVETFEREVVRPLRSFAGKTHDLWAGIRGALLPGSTAQAYARALSQHLYAERTLQDLPRTPRFVFNASNLQSTALFRFSNAYCADYRVGCIPEPTFRLADVVAASGAFPPFFSPLELDLSKHRIVREEGNDLHRPPYTQRALLADGGVYDNLGLETIYKRYRTLLVSDGGGRTAPEEDPPRDWLRQPVRVMKILDLQVRNLRYRMLMTAYTSGQRTGAYWGIRTKVDDLHVPGTLPCPLEATQALAAMPTRLKAVKGELQERLINWGYAVADAALRRYVVPDAEAPRHFPYPKAGVG